MIVGRIKFFLFKRLDKMLWLICFILGKINFKKMDKSTIQTILVIKLSAMGDALSLMPTLRAIKSAYPECQITWLTTHRTNPRLFTNIPFIDKIVTLIPVRRSTIPFLVQILFHPYDLSIDFDQYYQISEIISFIASHGNNVGFRTKLKGKSMVKFIDYDPMINEKIMFFNLAQTAFSEPLPEVEFILPELLIGHSVSKDVIKFSEQFNGQIIYMYAGSSDNASFRRWPMVRFLELASSINNEFSNYKIVFVGGPDEINFKSIVKTAGFTDIINQYSLQEVFYLFTKSKLFIGNDGGLLHLAESAGLPIVGIFGCIVAPCIGLGICAAGSALFSRCVKPVDTKPEILDL